TFADMLVDTGGYFYYNGNSSIDSSGDHLSTSATQATAYFHWDSTLNGVVLTVTNTSTVSGLYIPDAAFNYGGNGTIHLAYESGVHSGSDSFDVTNSNNQNINGGGNNAKSFDLLYDYPTGNGQRLANSLDIPPNTYNYSTYLITAGSGSNLTASNYLSLF